MYGTGLFADRDRPGWDEERERLQEALEALPPARTLDVACGTGWLTRHLPGEIVGLDQSESMLEVARERVPDGEFVVGDALSLPFADGSFERVFTATSTGTSRNPSGGASSWRHAVSPRSSSSSTRRCTRSRPLPVAGASAQRRLELAGLQALLHAGRGSPWSSAAVTAPPATGSSSSARHDAATLVLSLPRFAPAKQPGVPGVRRSGLPARVAAGARGPRGPARVHVRPGAGEWSRARSAGPGAAARDRRFGAGSSSRKTSSTRRSTARR